MPEALSGEARSSDTNGAAGLARIASHAVLWNIVLAPLLAILSLLSSILVARALALDEYRVYSLAIAAIASLLLWSDLGISSAVARFTPELAALGPEASSRFLRGVGKIRVLSLSALVLVLLAGKYFGPYWETVLPLRGTLFVLIIATVTLQSLARVYQYFLAGMFRRKAIGVVQLAAAGAQSALVIAAALAGLGVAGILGAIAVAALLEFGLSLGASRERNPAPEGRSGDLPRDLVREAARFAIVSFLEKTASYLNSPFFVVFLIASLGTYESVAFFAVAAEFAMRFVSMLSVPFTGITLPLFSTVEARSDAVQSATVLRLYVMLLFLLFAPTAAVVSGVADVLLPLVYGPRYQDAVPILKLLVPFLFLEYTVYSALLAALMTRRKYRQVLMAKLPLLLGVPAVALAIPVWGAAGAVAAFGSARLLSAAWLLIGGLRELRFQFPTLYASKVVAASIGAAMAIGFARRALSTGWGSLAALLLVGAASFFALYKASGGMAPADRALMLSGMPTLGRRLSRLL